MSGDELGSPESRMVLDRKRLGRSKKCKRRSLYGSRRAPSSTAIEHEFNSQSELKSINSTWETEGSAYVGQRVRRAVVEDDIEIGYGKGIVIGWLSAEKSEFISPDKCEPVALWHVVYDEVVEYRDQYPIRYEIERNHTF